MHLVDVRCGGGEGARHLSPYARYLNCAMAAFSPAIQEGLFPPCCSGSLFGDHPPYLIHGIQNLGRERARVFAQFGTRREPQRFK